MTRQEHPSAAVSLGTDRMEALGRDTRVAPKRWGREGIEEFRSLEGIEEDFHS